MTLHIESGHPYMADVKNVSGKFVRIVTEDDRTMFEVTIGKDGRSIEIRGVSMTKVDGAIYTEQLSIQPNSSNSVTIRPVLYEEGGSK